MDLNSFDLLELQTSYLQQDATIQALCKALTPYLDELSKCIIITYLYGRIDELNGEVVDELAWQFHVDFYDSSLSLEEKKMLVKNSIWWHKIKGTPQALIEVITPIFSNTKLQEWFEYEGELFKFSVDIDIIDEILTKENLKRVFDLIATYKNMRSWLEVLKLHLYARSTGYAYLGSTLISTVKYVLTSDFDTIYNSNSREKLATTTINTKKYELTNDIYEENESTSNQNQASSQSISLHYKLS